MDRASVLCLPALYDEVVAAAAEGILVPLTRSRHCVRRARTVCDYRLLAARLHAELQERFAGTRSNGAHCRLGASRSPLLWLRPARESPHAIARRRILCQAGVRSFLLSWVNRAARHCTQARSTYESAAWHAQQAEAANFLLLEEQEFVDQYIASEDQWRAHRRRLSHHVSPKRGYVRSELESSQPVFMYGPFLQKQRQNSTEATRTALADAHVHWSRTRTDMNCAAAILVQRAWRTAGRLRRFASVERSFNTRTEHLARSAARAVERMSMRCEDERARLFQLQDRSARVIQRVYARFLAVPQTEDLDMDYRALLVQERRRAADARFKQHFRARVEKEKQLRAWVCPECTELGFRHQPFISWESVESHLRTHSEWACKRALAKSAKALQAEQERCAKIERERSMLELSRKEKAERERTRYRAAFVLASWAARRYVSASYSSPIPRSRLDGTRKEEQIIPSFVLLQEGYTKLGRSRRRCGIVLDSPTRCRLVSNHHLDIFLSGRMNGAKSPSIIVTDCGSTNGTSVNGVELKPFKATPVKWGDRLVLGGCSDRPGDESELQFVVALVDLES